MNHTVPSSIITLYKMPVDTTYRNVMDFSSQSELTAYLNKFDPHTPTFPGGTPNYSYYIRRNSTVDIPLIFDECEQYTYCKYNNGEGEEDEYAFIIDKQFINMSTTRIRLMYDVWTNFLVKTNFRPNGISGLIQRCFTTSTDYNILNDIPAIPTVKSDLYSYSSMTPIVFVTYDSDSISARVGGSEVSGSYKSIAFGERTGGLIARITTSLDDLTEMVVHAGKFGGITGMYVMNIPTAVMNKIENNPNISGITLYENSISNVPIIYGLAVTPKWNNTFAYSSFMSTDLEIPIGLNSDFVDSKILTSPYSMVELLLGETSTSFPISEMPDVDKFAFNYDLRFCSSGIVARIKPLLRYSHSQILYVNSVPLVRIIDKSRTEIMRAGLAAVSTSLGMSGNGGLAYAISAAANANPDKSSMNISSADILKGNSSYSTGISGSPIDFLGNCYLAHMTPDTVNMGVNNGISAMLSGGAGNIIVRTYKCIPEIVENLEKYWGRYGYPQNRYESEINVRKRTIYDYFKLLDCQVSSSIMCQSEINVLRRIFETGVAIYHYNSSMLTCPFGNIYSPFENTIRT